MTIAATKLRREGSGACERRQEVSWNGGFEEEERGERGIFLWEKLGIGERIFPLRLS